MSWSWKIGRVAGIPIYIHWTFLILLGWIAFGHWLEGHDVAATAEGVGFVLVIFGCVVLHELGHALTARSFGVKTADITLLPIGGVARMERIPEKPVQELLVALAGPMVNVAIVGLLLLANVRFVLLTSEAEALLHAPFWSRVLFFNGVLVLFNLLPAFPMDGGRVLRAVLAMTMDYVRATRTAATVGQGMAILFGFLGLGGDPILLLIALFVWIGAEAEARQVAERFAFRGLPARAAMLTEFHVLLDSETLGHAADLLLAGTQHDFPIERQGQPKAVLTRTALLAGLSIQGRDAPIGSADLAELGQVAAGSDLIEAVERLRSEKVPCLLVVEDDDSLGLLTLENVMEFLWVSNALAGRHP